MWSDADFVDLTIVAALYMGAVRSMLSNISFVYENYYEMNSFASGVLISVPTFCGIFSSMAAIAAVRKWSTRAMLRYGMLVAVLGPVAMVAAAGFPHCGQEGYALCPYAEHLAFINGSKHGWGSAWWVVASCMAIMSATGFFTLPAMQTVVMQDLKDISGLAGGLSKMVMQFLSTGMAMIASWIFTHDGSQSDDSQHHLYTHYHTQRLLYTLAVMLLTCQLHFWVFYCFLRPLCCAGKQEAESLSSPAGEGATPTEPLLRDAGPGSPPDTKGVEATADKGDREDSFEESPCSSGSDDYPIKIV